MVPAADDALVVSVRDSSSASGAGEAGEFLFHPLLAGKSLFGSAHGLSSLWVSIKFLICPGEDVL